MKVLFMLLKLSLPHLIICMWWQQINLTWRTARSPAQSHGGWTGQWMTPWGRCTAPLGGQIGPAGACETSHCTGELWGFSRTWWATYITFQIFMKKLQQMNTLNLICNSNIEYFNRQLMLQILEILTALKSFPKYSLRRVTCINLFICAKKWSQAGHREK